MTAFPDQTGAFATQPNPQTLQKPLIAEHFWGIEVSSGDGSGNLASALRLAKAMVAVAAFALAFLLWLPPFAGLLAGATAAKGIGCVAMLLAGVTMARAASRGTAVFVQLDVRAGEIRAVSYNLFGQTNVLARYGMDAVEGLRIRRSAKRTGVAQIQILIDGSGAIPAGTGSVSCVQSLRNRMLDELGLTGGDVRTAVWAGPRAA